jgi:hypothetical protein
MLVLAMEFSRGAGQIRSAHDTPGTPHCGAPRKRNRGLLRHLAGVPWETEIFDHDLTDGMPTG